MFNVNEPKSVKLIELLFKDIIQHLRYNMEEVPKEELYFYDNLDNFMDNLELVEKESIDSLIRKINDKNHQLLVLENKIKKLERNQGELVKQHTEEIAKLKRVIDIKNERIKKLGGDITDVKIK